MNTVNAYLNFGRWLVDCPKHGKNGALEVTEHTTEYIPPCCYPGIIAQFMGVVKGRIANVPDVSARATARKMAEAKDEIYQVVFPENRNEIIGQLSLREIKNQNWQPGETVEFLMDENVQNGVI